MVTFAQLPSRSKESAAVSATVATATMVGPYKKIHVDEDAVIDEASTSSSTEEPFKPLQIVYTVCRRSEGLIISFASLWPELLLRTRANLL
jgi:hypothetical protein